MFIFIGYIWNEDYIIILLEVFIYKKNVYDWVFIVVDN